jgi:hypothetical protein
MNSGHRQECYITIKCNVSDIGLLPSSDEGKESPAVLYSVERTNLKQWFGRKSVSPLPENGDSSNFGNIYFSSYSEFGTMDRIRKLGDFKR